MEFTDWVTIALIIGGIVLESRRGSLTAWVDVAGVVVAYRAAVYLYPHMFADALSSPSCFLVVFGMVMVAVAFVSMHTRRSTERLMATFDYFLGGLGGAVSGMVLSAVMFQFVLLAFGRSDPWFAGSVFRPVLYDLTWYQQLVQQLGR